MVTMFHLHRVRTNGQSCEKAIILHKFSDDDLHQLDLYTQLHFTLWQRQGWASTISPVCQIFVQASSQAYIWCREILANPISMVFQKEAWNLTGKKRLNVEKSLTNFSTKYVTLSICFTVCFRFCV